MTTLPPGAYFGDTVRRRDAGGLIFSESRYPPHLRIPRHTHESPFLYFVLHGSSTEGCRNRTRSVRALGTVFHPAGEAHANHWHEAGGHLLHVEVGRDALSRLQTYPLDLGQPIETDGGVSAWLASRLHRELSRTDAASGLAPEGLAFELLAELFRSRETIDPRRPPGWQQIVRDLLHDQFQEDLSLEEIASAAGVHPAHLARVFRSHHGCSIGDYLRSLRIEFACQQLSSTHAALVDVALAAGFADQSHFTRCFKQVTGLTPGQFRRRSPPRSDETTPRSLEARQAVGPGATVSPDQRPGALGWQRHRRPASSTSMPGGRQEPVK
jgi:AraC family transcriptional regulator